MPHFDLILANEGTRPAEGVLIEIIARGNLKIGRPALVKEGQPSYLALDPLPSPPIAPKGDYLRNSGLARLLASSRGAGWSVDTHMPFVPRTIHEMLDPSRLNCTPDRGEAADRIIMRKGIWRHKAEPIREAIFIDTESEAGSLQGAIDIRISAHNLSQVVTTTLPVKLDIDQGDTFSFATGLVEDLPGAAGST